MLNLRRRIGAPVLVVVAAAAVWVTAAAGNATLAALEQQTGAAPKPVLPRYNASRALELPADYRQWIFVGSSLGLSYSEAGAGHEMFHHTLMEPTAYGHFVRTGAFREGTMLVLMLHGTGQGVLPSRRGQFAAEIHGVEMAVKDKTRTPEGWAYYNFGGMEGIRNTADPMPKASCYNCHVEHAARDNVFLQFYPLLAEAARLTLPRPAPAAARSSAPAAPAATPVAVQTAASTSSGAVALALRGLDPVLLVQGREEMGKPEIVAAHRGYTYQFVSEPHRAAFAADLAKFAIQNTTCPVVPGAPVDPALFAVHNERVYAFATADCVRQFKRQPGTYLSNSK